MSGAQRDNYSINWNFENEYSSITGMPAGSGTEIPNKYNSQGQVSSLKSNRVGNMIRSINKNQKQMKGIPELANESKFSENLSSGNEFGIN